MALSVGEEAPRFVLPSGPGEHVDVGVSIGRDMVVLLFFPFAFSPVCTAEMCAIREDWSVWEAVGARVYGISVDSPVVNDRFRREERLPFPLLSDYNRRVAREYDVLYDAYGLEGVAMRSVFVIGTDGRVAYSWATDDAGREPDYEAVKAAMRSA